MLSQRLLLGWAAAQHGLDWTGLVGKRSRSAIELGLGQRINVSPESDSLALINRLNDSPCSIRFRCGLGPTTSRMAGQCQGDTKARNSAQFHVVDSGKLNWLRVYEHTIQKSMCGIQVWTLRRNYERGIPKHQTGSEPNTFLGF